MGMSPNRSIFDDARHEAQREKWIRSYHAQRDLGHEAILMWAREHWNGFLRAKWHDHLLGRVHYHEFAAHTCGALNRDFRNPQLVRAIMDRLAAGKENLDIFQWAKDRDDLLDEIFEILEAVDVNSCRLSFDLHRCS